MISASNVEIIRAAQPELANGHRVEDGDGPNLRVDVTEIEAYEQNPRQHANPEYDRIKASIRVKGLDQPLVITRRPDENCYVLHAGGGTRLRILKELYDERPVDQFRWVNCYFKPWEHESDVLLAHLRKNELRGGLHFIDKAQAVFKAKQLFEEELGVDSLSLRQLEKRLREQGFSVNVGLISKLSYAAHRLLPLIPQALSAGLGRPQVEKIRALDRAACEVWTRLKVGDETEFGDVFSALCQRYDSPDWDFESLKIALENELALAAERNLQTVRMALDAALEGRDCPILRVEEDDNLAWTEESPSVEEENKPNDTKGGAEETALSSECPENDPEEGSSAPCPESQDDLRSLRSQAYTLASRLAQNNGLANLVHPLPDDGLGFILGDIPDPELADVLDDELLSQVAALWWQLVACSEMTVTPPALLIHYLEEGTVLRQALEAQDVELIVDHVLAPEHGQLGYHLWRQLNREDWQGLVELIDTYRKLHRVANEEGLSLWCRSEEER